MEVNYRKPLDLARIADYCIYTKTPGKPYSARFQYFSDLGTDDAIKTIQLIITGSSMSREEEDFLAKQVSDLAGSGGAWIVGDDGSPRLVPRA